MKTRFLLHSASSYQSLKRHNPPFNFAKECALRLFKSNAIYSFIPKNACSTMRLSIAIDNGVIKTTDDFKWIHHNNDTFSAELADLATANYTFVVLRCPYKRLASVYLDKMVGRTLVAQNFKNALQSAINLNELTFTDFVKNIQKKEVKTYDIHWREQVDFLIYEEYDDYFCVEDFDKVVSQLKQKIGLQVIDARDLTKHGTDRYLLLDENEDFSQTKALDILGLQRKRHCPHPKSLFSEEVVEIVENCYKDDIKLYSSIFGTSNLLFSGV